MTAPGPASPDRRLLALLCCPLSRQPLRFDREAGALVTADECFTYPLRDGVPLFPVKSGGRAGSTRLSPARP